VSFKRGIVLNDLDFFNWINTKSSGTMERRDIRITLLNERQEPILRWKLRNCFPTKYIGPVLMANDSSIAVETLVVVHEGMEMESMG
jgi:phage tail-like protein